MKKRTAELILKDPEKFAHHDRVFLNNPVVMQGMGLAPLVVVATTGQNGLMLAAAVTLLLVPSRVLACLLSRLVPLRDEEPTPEQLQKKLLPRALLYAASAAVVYLAAYPILNFVFGTGLLNLGIYLPMLVVEPLLTYRFGRVQETVHKAVSKGVRILLRAMRTLPPASVARLSFLLCSSYYLCFLLFLKRQNIFYHAFQVAARSRVIAASPTARTSCAESRAAVNQISQASATCGNHAFIFHFDNLDGGCHIHLFPFLFHTVSVLLLLIEFGSVLSVQAIWALPSFRYSGSRCPVVGPGVVPTFVSDGSGR